MTEWTVLYDSLVCADSISKEHWDHAILQNNLFLFQKYYNFKSKKNSEDMVTKRDLKIITSIQ